MNDNQENLEQKETLTDPIENQNDQGAADDNTLDLEGIILEALANPSPKVKAWLDNHIKTEVKKLLAGKTPQKQTIPTSSVMTRQDFEKLSYAERVEMFQSNPQAYHTLTQ